MRSTVLIPCEKLIIDREGAHSIINVMLRVQVKLETQKVGEKPAATPIPPDAVAPLQWWLYTVWDAAPQDVGKEFEQVYQVYWPNDEKLLEARLPFTQKNIEMQQTSYSIAGLPVGQPGDIKIKTWLDSSGHRVTEISETHIVVNHVPASTPMPATANLTMGRF